MTEKNIKFSSVPVTESLHEAIKGAAELSGTSEKDIIHQSLAFFVWRIIQSSSETITLKGESVEEDFNLLKYHWKLQKEEKRVFLRYGGTARHLRMISKAMKKYQEWLEDKEDNVSRDHDPFESFLENIEHEKNWENELSEIKTKIATLQLSLDPENFEANETIHLQLKKLEKDLKLKEQEGEKYRENKGYLQSEIPPGTIPFPQNFIDDKIAQIITTVNAGNIPSIDDLLYLILFGKGAYNQIKKGIIKLAGKKRAKRLFKAVEKRIRKHLDDVVDAVTDKIDPDA